MKKLRDSLLPVFAISIITIGFLPVFPLSDAESSEYVIPTWVKGIAGFWVEDRITDQDFGDGLAFLITERIIEVPLLESLQDQVTDLENQVELLENQNQELEDENIDLKIQRIRTPPLHGDPPRVSP